MRALRNTKLPLLLSGLLVFCPTLHASEVQTPKSYITAGLGIEQLSYQEKIPDLALASTDTELSNWILYLEGQKAMAPFFVGVKGYIPLTDDDTREAWYLDGLLEQSNSLSYKRMGLDGYFGYGLHPLLNPYVGINWGYTEQTRSNFQNNDSPGTLALTATEEVYSLSALLGLKGNIPFTPSWSFFYAAEFMLPFYSETTNDSLPDWKASDVGGYAYTLAARLQYTITQTLSAAAWLRGGRQHWAGSPWSSVDGTRVKWPENDTDFLGTFISLSLYF